MEFIINPFEQVFRNLSVHFLHMICLKLNIFDYNKKFELFICVCMIFTQILVTLMQIFYMKSLTDFSIKKYLTETIKPIFFVCILLIPVKFLFYNSFFSIHFIFSFLITMITTTVMAYFVGLNVAERNMIHKVLKKITHKQ